MSPRIIDLLGTLAVAIVVAVIVFRVTGSITCGGTYGEWRC